VAPAARFKELSGALLEIAADPVGVASLHGVLRPFSHEFRNRLNSLNLARYLATAGQSSTSPEVWRQVDGAYRALVELIDHIQLICRPVRLTPIRCSLDDLIQERSVAWTRWLGDQGRRLELLAPIEPAAGCFDPARLIQGLDALAAWRAAAGTPGSPVHLSWQGQDSQLILDWFEPGQASHAAPPGDDQPISLALPVVARVVTAHGGTLKIGSRRGARFTLRWPHVLPRI
jgi:signal transduction histidine kinase